MDAIMLDRAAVRAMLPARDDACGKWAFGRLLLVCGCADMPGAAVLCALAAARSGAGLIRAAAVPGVCAAIAAHVPECTLAHMPEGPSGEISARALGVLLAEAEKSTAVVLGCGLGRSHGAGELVRAFVLQCATPLVLDADALNIISENPSILLEKAGELLVTPHLREFARLCALPAEKIARSPASCAAVFAARYRLTVALKGGDTYIAAPGGEVWVNSLPNSGMAKGGSGDALAGLIGGLLAQGLPPEHAAAAGVYLHSRAGAIARDETGAHAMRVSDVISRFPAAFNAVLTDN